MTDLRTLQHIALRQGLAIRRARHVERDRYDLVDCHTGDLVAEGLTQEQMAADMLGDSNRA